MRDNRRNAGGEEKMQSQICCKRYNIIDDTDEKRNNMKRISNQGDVLETAVI